MSYPTMANQILFSYFIIKPEIIHLEFKIYMGFPLWLGNVEILFHERGVDLSYQSVRY